MNLTISISRPPTPSYIMSIGQMFLIGCCAQTAIGAKEYSDRSMFEAQLDQMVTDDYEQIEYQTGDILDEPDIDIHSNSSMNSVFGETQYTTTGFADWNLIIDRDGDRLYCSGCNGSYLLDFSSTSVGTMSGVFGVGLNVRGVEGPFNTTAFVTFGDGTTENFAIPEVDAFWGITAPELISTIHFGLPDGGTNTDNYVQRMAMDNLTIGSAIPEPGSLILLLVGFGAIAWGGRRKHLSASPMTLGRRGARFPTKVATAHASTWSASLGSSGVKSYVL